MGKTDATPSDASAGAPCRTRPALPAGGKAALIQHLSNPGDLYQKLQTLLDTLPEDKRKAWKTKG
jgi:hypothetical protein